MRRGAFCITEYVCPICKTVMTVPRKNGQKREKNHVKHMWCPVCKDRKGFIQGEVR